LAACHSAPHSFMMVWAFAGPELTSATLNTINAVEPK
jgi:hypothetical protein